MSTTSPEHQAFDDKIGGQNLAPFRTLLPERATAGRRSRCQPACRPRAAFIQLLPKGFAAASRSTDDNAFARGRRRMIFRRSGDNHLMQWGKRDVSVVPSPHHFRHDRPIQQAPHLFREDQRHV